MTFDRSAPASFSCGRRLVHLLAGVICLVAMDSAGGRAYSASLPAQSASVVKEPTAQNTHLHYSVFIHGYHVVDTDVDYVMQPWGYGIQTHLYTIGLASWFLTLNLLSNAQGRFDGSAVTPVAFDNQGFSRSEQRHAHIDFDSSGPHVTVLTPPESGREPLPQPELRVSADMLSYLVELTHRMATGQGCSYGRPIFDGVHLSYLDMHGPSAAIVPKDHHPAFRGDAQRCDFMGKQIGGFSIGSPNKVAQATPHPGAVWFIHDDKAGTLPVRIEFTHPKLGLILVVLQQSPRLSPVSPEPTH